MCNISQRSIPETRLGTSYLHHGPKVHPEDRVGDKLQQGSTQVWVGQKGAGKVPGAMKTSYHPQNLPRGCCELCPILGRSRLLLEVTPCPEKPNRYCTGPFFAPS